MAKTKKSSTPTAKTTKPIADVAHPGTTAPPDTSKPIITSRPIMKDPMVVEEGIDKPAGTAEKPLRAKTSEIKIKPLDESAAPSEDSPKDETTDKPAETSADKPEPEIKSEEEPADDQTLSDKTDVATETDTDSSPAGKKTNKKTKKPDSDDEKAAEQAAKDAKLQQLIESKKYFLPINAVEQRRTARFVALGFVLALILVAIWIDIALDAGLIHIGNVKALTHFFSN